MAEDRRVGNVRVLGMDDQAADLPGVVETEMGPAIPAVGGLVDAVPRGDVPPDAGRAGADIDDAGSESATSIAPMELEV